MNRRGKRTHTNTDYFTLSERDVFIYWLKNKTVASLHWYRNSSQASSPQITVNVPRFSFAQCTGLSWLSWRNTGLSCIRSLSQSITYLPWGSYFLSSLLFFSYFTWHYQEDEYRLLFIAQLDFNKCSLHIQDQYKEWCASELLKQSRQAWRENEVENKERNWHREATSSNVDQQRRTAARILRARISLNFVTAKRKEGSTNSLLQLNTRCTKPGWLSSIVLECHDIFVCLLFLFLFIAFTHCGHECNKHRKRETGKFWNHSYTNDSSSMDMTKPGNFLQDFHRM